MRSINKARAAIAVVAGLVAAVAIGPAASATPTIEGTSMAACNGSVVTYVVAGNRQASKCYTSFTSVVYGVLSVKAGAYAAHYDYYDANGRSMGRWTVPAGQLQTHGQGQIRNFAP